jgi:hypothetical protein
MTESCGSDAAVKKAPYSSAALETEAADYIERHHHERDAEGRALVVHTAVLEANRIDLLFILIGFEAERAKSPAIQPASPEESLSATVARICATDKSIQRFCADRTLGISAKAAFSPCSLRRSPASALISCSVPPGGAHWWDSHSPAVVTRWLRFDHAACKSASFLFVGHPSLDLLTLETPVCAYPKCGQLLFPEQPIDRGLMDPQVCRQFAYGQHARSGSGFGLSWHRRRPSFLCW